ncbi:hypothetical protein A2U01_0083322, partial [Trifolium medium]|nr:hypothetical protein [Trifolium medium]
MAAVATLAMITRFTAAGGRTRFATVG